MKTQETFQPHDPKETLLTEIDKRLASIESRIAGSPAEKLNWFDHQSICQLLHVIKRTLDNYRERGLLPFSKIGGKVHYRTSDIDHYLNTHLMHKKERKSRNV